MVSNLLEGTIKKLEQESIDEDLPISYTLERLPKKRHKKEIMFSDFP